MRLGQLVHELNISIDTAFELLKKKGFAIEDANPNYKLSDKEEEILRSGFTKSTGPSVLGTIDLSSINSQRKQNNGSWKNSKVQVQDNHIQKTQSKETTLKYNDKNLIRDVWQRFVDIQEKLIKQRCSPISIDVESIVIENDKLYVTVDESQKEQQLDFIFKERLGVENYDLTSGSVYVDEGTWNSLNENDLSEIRRTLSDHYIELDTTPTIGVTIDYGSGIGKFDQMSLEDLCQLESILSDGKLIEGEIDNIAAFISKVLIKKEEFLRYLFGDHYKVVEKRNRKNEESTLVDVLEYTNQYIPWDEYQKYNKEIGLRCNSYTLIFKINNSQAEEFLMDTLEISCPETRSFEWKRNFTDDSPFTNDFLTEINGNIKKFMDEATIYCSLNDVEIEVVFTYSISKMQLVKLKFNEVAAFLSSRDNCSFNVDNGAIGIDFNWRTDNIDDIINDIEKHIQFVTINKYENHRFKCNVSTQIVGFDSIKGTLEDKYDDIIVLNDGVNHKISIRLPYVEIEYYDMLVSRLINDLSQISVAGIDVKFEPKIEGKVRLNVKFNDKSRLEDLEDNILELRRADFGFLLNGKDIIFGKLLRANYPNLIFDIDVKDDVVKDKVIEALESKAVNTLMPILTGEYEKISRLKNTFTKATTGSELLNSNLQRFLFDSSTATKTQDIDLYLNEDSYAYKDLCKNLLNSRVNESQKQAILKALNAEDLAVIQGPPGTGKSTAIAELIWQLVRNGLKQGNKRERILLTSETNLAVDNAISRIVNNKTNLVKPIRFGGEEKLESEGLQFSIELMKRWVEDGDSCLTSVETDEESGAAISSNLILKNWLDNISNRSFAGMDDENAVASRWRKYLSNPDSELRHIVYDRYIETANVIGATCSSIGEQKASNAGYYGATPFFRNYCDIFKQKKGRPRIEFTTVIQDESSKATPAELVLPFVYGKRAIVIGDHRQLPPMLDKEEFEETLQFALRSTQDPSEVRKIEELKEYVSEHFDEMEISHFQRLYENIDSSLKGTFNLQYRMHPDINEVIEQFYREDGGLRCGLTTPVDLGVNNTDVTNPTSRYHGIEIPGIMDQNTHVIFINTDSPEMKDGTSRVNYGEVETIDRLLTRFENSSSFLNYLNKFEKEEDKQIGVISFYGKQIKQLRSVAYSHPTLPIRVSTVDRFQGMERNIVIVSMVRSNVIQSTKDQQPDRKRYPDYGYAKQSSLGFAESPNRLNVALSRAKRLLVIVGNRELFSSLDIYQRLFWTIEANGNNRVLNQNEV